MTMSLRAVVLVAVFTLLTQIPLNAGATYLEKGFYCSSNGTSGSLTIHWPSLTSSGNYAEPVYFMAIVYKWNPNTGTFQEWSNLPLLPRPVLPYDLKTWYYGLVGPNGPMILDAKYGYKWKAGINGPYATNPTIALPKGYYKVAEFFRWQYGSYGSTWATLLPRLMAEPSNPAWVAGSVPNGYCTI
jgi:hypothetical protein